MKGKLFLTPRLTLKALAGLFAVGLLIVLGFFIFSLFPSRTPQDTNSLQQPGAQPLSPDSTPSASQPDPTAGWKIASIDRSNISLKFKFPADWSSPYNYCAAPSNTKGFDLPPNCAKIVLITENLPDENAELGRDMVVTSETQMVINGYKAKRKVYSLQEDETKTPDTYELWVYDRNRPFLLFLAWIGVGTDLQTATNFVRIHDRMIGTLELRRR